MACGETAGPLAAVSNIQISRTWVLAVVSAAPVLFIGSLFQLAEWGFAHKCADWPRCRENGIGLSLASLIQTPQATGMTAAVFFWPFTRLWSLKHLLVDRKLGILSLLGIYVSAGLFLVAPIDIFPTLNLAASLSFSVSAATHYLMLLLYAGGLGSLVARSVLGMGAVSFALLVALSLAIHGLHAATLVHRVPFWLCYFLEALGLSCTAIVPAFLGKTPPELTRARTDEVVETVFGVCGRFMLRGVAILPVAYLWCLPALAELALAPCPASWPYGCAFARKCRGYPSCAESDIGFSVSSLILTPQATGGLAISFLAPFAHTWSLMERHHWREPGDFITLLLFYIFFSLFLSAPVNAITLLHFFAVGSFCSAAMAHSIFLLQRLPKDTLGRRRLEVLLKLAAVAFVSVVLLKALATALNMTGVWLADYVPWLFWFCECVGLSSLLVFPWLWDDMKRDTVLGDKGSDLDSVESGGESSSCSGTSVSSCDA